MGDAELPDFLRRSKVQTTEEEFLYCEEVFYGSELSYIGPVTLILKVCARVDKHMEAAGAIRPFVYSCKHEAGAYVLRCEEQAYPTEYTLKPVEKPL